MKRRIFGISLAGILAALSSLAIAVFHNALGNFLDRLLEWGRQNIFISIMGDPWPWGITLVAILGTLASFYYFQRRYRILGHALETLHNMVELDDSLLRLLASWIPSRDHEVEVKGLLAELLHDAMAEFDDEVRRAALFRPDVKGENLEIWTHYGMPTASVDFKKFYIGKERSKWQDRGVAGQAFLKRERHLAHMTKENRIWRCDCEGYKKFGDHAPAYRSFVVLPILGAEPHPTSSGQLPPLCLGVVCFDSMNPTIFDSPESQELLLVFARRIAATLMICQQLPGLPDPAVGEGSNHVSSGGQGN